MKSKSRHGEMPIGLYDARAFIDEHWDRPLNLEDIAQRAHFSRYHFLRLFRQLFHETPHEYLTRRRIEKAKEMLANSELSVTEISQVGFESLGSFSTLFRQVVGWSPSIYRARVIEQRRTPFKFIPVCYRIMYGMEISKERNFR